MGDSEEEIDLFEEESLSSSSSEEELDDSTPDEYSVVEAPSAPPYEFHDTPQQVLSSVDPQFIENIHPEESPISPELLQQLLPVTRDRDGNIVDANHTTLCRLTRFEMTRVLGFRVKQLNAGAAPFIQGEFANSTAIAVQELRERKLPFILVRYLPNGTFEAWALADLEIFL